MNLGTFFSFTAKWFIISHPKKVVPEVLICERWPRIYFIPIIVHNLIVWSSIIFPWSACHGSRWPYRVFLRLKIMVEPKSVTYFMSHYSRSHYGWVVPAAHRQQLRPVLVTYWGQAWLASVRTPAVMGCCQVDYGCSLVWGYWDVGGQMVAVRFGWVEFAKVSKK